MSASLLGQFNLAQLSTYDEAREIAQKLSAGPIVVGGGVKPENSNQDLSGIYRPSWLPGPGAFPEPNYVDEVTGKKYYFLHFRFRNGAEGMNVGLIKDKFRRYPSSPLYVLGQLAQEANEMANG